MERRNFLWGAATAAHQVEGDNQHSDWWRWEKEGNIEGGALSGKACDHWRLFREDLQLAKSLGLNSYRFSIEWAKIEPVQGEWNEEAFAWYDSLLQECEKLEIVPMLTLHHFTLPAWMADKGGFAVKESITHFVRFASEVIRRFGDRIPLWCTFNEPLVLCLGAYLGGFMPPAKNNPELIGVASRNILDAHALTYDLLHRRRKKRVGPFAHFPLEVGIAHNMMDFLPDRMWHPIEQIVAGALDRFYNRAWLDAITGAKQNFGLLGLIKAPEQNKMLHGHRTADYIGVNFYTKAFVRWKPRDSGEGVITQLPLGVSFARKEEPQSDMGWAIHPDGFRKALECAASYNLPIYVTENGIADRADRYRRGYIFDHLLEISKANENGANIRGFYYWSLLDNFEWSKGFGPRFGLFEVDYETKERKARASALAYRDIIRAHEGTAAPQADILKSLR